MVAGIIIGVGLLLYPTIANYWNSFHQTRAIMGYNKSVASLSQKDYDRILKDAREYNRKLGETGIIWNMSDEQKAEYNKQLNVDGTGIMGYVTIPQIRIKAPIYHGTNESVLQTAIGHLEQTSLPIGGKSSHSQISGHRGLPSARLFTDIDKIREGDTWTMTILDKTVTYQCDKISIVEPDDLSKLSIKKGKDQCTLITCTPYGINTHRLLVRGHRIPNADGNAALTADAVQVEPRYVIPFLAAAILILVIILSVIASRRARKYDPDRILREQKARLFAQ
ncbi:MAG: class C sortase [Firmicutes bacterium]|nr:class C sortase [Bacillota bacterium]